MDGAIERFVEAVRQRELVNSGALVRQVKCESRYHWLLDIPGTKCSRCKAAL